MNKLFLFAIFMLGYIDLAHASAWVEVVTPKGLVVWLASDSAASQVSVQALWLGGSESDASAPKQLSASASAMMMEGSGDLDAVAFAGAAEDAGINIAFGAEREYLALGLTVGRAERLRAQSLLKSALLRPRFDAADAERLRRSLKSDLPELWKQSGFMASVALARLMLPDHPKLKAMIGPNEDPPRIAPDVLRAWHKNHFARSNLLIAIAGAVSTQEAVDFVDDTFGNLPEKANVPPPPPRHYKGAGQTVVVPREGDQTLILISQPVPGGIDDEGTASDLLSDILGREAPSRLFKAIREQRGLSYGVEASIHPSDLGSVLVIATSVPNEKAADVLKILHGELDKLAADGVDSKEISALRALRRAAHGRELTSPDEIASQMIFNRLRHCKVDDFDKEPDRDDAVPLTLINKVARDYFSSSRSTTILVGQPQELGTLRRLAIP